MEPQSQEKKIRPSSSPFEPEGMAKRRKVTHDPSSNSQNNSEPNAFIDLLTDMEVDVKNENTEASWKRPEVPKLNSSTDKIVFQQIEVDDYIDYNIREPIIRLYGITAEGNSVVCNVKGFFPYFYFPAPSGFTEAHIKNLKTALTHQVGEGVIHSISMHMKQSIYGYHGKGKSPYVRITVKDPKDLSKCKTKIENGIAVQGYLAPCQSSTVYESNISYVLRFMIDCKVTGSNWIELPAGTWSFSQIHNSTAQIEVETRYDKFISHQPENEWSGMAPLRIMSFDIECAGRKGVFPEANVDPVIQIAAVVQIQGQKKPFIRNVFTLRDCSNIVGTHILSFDREEDLLKKWAEFMRAVDPDVVIGYNTSNFDFPYLLDRAKHLKVTNFPFLGRIKNTQTTAKVSKFSSKAFGTRENMMINLEGRLQLDIFQAIQRDYKLRSYTLNSVSAEFLNEQKEDVHHSMITDLFNGTPETRRRLAVYCLKDAFLPLRLMDKLMLLTNYTEMARVTGVPFNYILVRGQQIKVISQLYRRALEQDLVVPVLRTEMTEEQYEGATVIEPIRGYYDKPIATLDFTSLYPSIMQAHNLCYTTLLNAEAIKRYNLVKDVDYEVTPNNDMFVKESVRKGLLPEILSDLLAARKRAKNDLKKETDPAKRAVLDGRQLALKISANSVYGFTGATIGKLPCLQISSSVTAYGRAMIFKTKETVEEHYTVANGYKYDAQVIYGDTDSVMIKFGVDNLKEAMELGREAAGLVTKKFIRPINLDFEKVYFPYLLINKKRYAGLYWTREDKYDKLDTKGIETVRRDNCRLVSRVISKCLDTLMIDRDVEGAQEYVKKVISDLLLDKIDLAQLVITKGLTKTDYAGKQAHVVLADRMKKRDPGSAPTLGDRVAYVIIKAGNNTPTYERVEEPLYVMENSIPIDTKYYLDNQLSKPLRRLFEPVFGEKATDQLLSGAHTHTVKISTPSVGGLMKFAVKKATCLACKATLPKDDNSAVCSQCVDKLPELYQHQLEVVNKLEIKFSKLWTQAQRSQSSLHQDIISYNKDSPIFYMCKKVQKDLDEAHKRLERFSYEW